MSGSVLIVWDVNIQDGRAISSTDMGVPHRDHRAAATEGLTLV